MEAPVIPAFAFGDERGKGIRGHKAKQWVGWYRSIAADCRKVFGKIH